MTETKYGKYIIEEPFMKRDPNMPRKSSGPALQIHSGELGAELAVGYYCYYPQPDPVEFLMPHSHDTYELLGFIGGNSQDIGEFGADVEIYLGEEMEKHVINKTSVVSIPPGLLHCPLIFKNITKPLIFLEIVLDSKYDKVITEDSLAKLSPEERKRLPKMGLEHFSPEILKKYGL